MSKPELKVVCVSGQKQQGKNSLADYLAPRLLRPVPVPVHGGILTEHRPWGQASFAFTVKKIFCEAFDKDLAFVEEWKVRDEPPPGMDKTVREALTFIGDGFRKIQPNIWIDLAFRPASDPYYRVFTDGRYLNEARRTRDEGGLNILLYREGGENPDDNDSERQVLPYVLWCKGAGRQGEIWSWPEFGLRDYATLDKSAESDAFFEGLSLYDLFIRCPDGVEHLHQRVDEIVIPYIVTNFEVNIA